MKYDQWWNVTNSHFTEVRIEGNRLFILLRLYFFLPSWVSEHNSALHLHSLLVIPVVPLLAVDGDRRNQCLFQFWMHTNLTCWQNEPDRQNKCLHTCTFLQKLKQNISLCCIFMFVSTASSLPSGVTIILHHLLACRWRCTPDPNHHLDLVI